MVTLKSAGFFADLPVDYTISWMSLFTALAVYNHVKKITLGECATVLAQKNLQLTEGSECFKLYFHFQTNTYRIYGLYIRGFIYLFIYLFIYYFFYPYQKKVFSQSYCRNRLFRPLTYKFYKTLTISKDYPQIYLL